MLRFNCDTQIRESNTDFGTLNSTLLVTTYTSIRNDHILVVLLEF